MGPKTTAAAALGTVLFALAPVAGGCQIRPESEQLGQPVSDDASVASGAEAEALGPGDADPGGPDLEDVDFDNVDFDNAVYAAACGLSWIEVGAGVGEGPSLGGIYGLEVIDVLVADLDDEPGKEAAVLVDCLGGDTYSPHVLGFDVGDLSSTGDGPVVLLASTGGSLPAGHQPVGIDIARDGELRVQLSGPDGEVERKLRWSRHVMAGGELAPVADSVVHGVIVAAEAEGVLVVTMAPGVGYRLSIPDGFTAIDPDTGSSVAAAEMSGRPARVSLDAAGSVAAVELLPLGAG